MLKKSVNFVFAIVLLAFSILLNGSAFAAPTSADVARAVVSGWLSIERRPLDSAISDNVARVETYRDTAGYPLYHIVYLSPAGLVIVAGDDLVEPIIGFLPQAATYDPSLANPLGAMVSGDVPNRVYQVRALADVPPDSTPDFIDELPKAKSKWDMYKQREAAPDGMGSISDVRVPPLTASKWDQATEGGTCATTTLPQTIT